ncbi:hypothetical protein B0H11DRAFT_1913680 [Mycena galericulata]|nr:hypothetical protein B0H11DRAFT_1913680 [Mycena galericulata]
MAANESKYTVSDECRLQCKQGNGRWHRKTQRVSADLFRESQRASLSAYMDAAVEEVNSEDVWMLDPRGISLMSDSVEQMKAPMLTVGEPGWRVETEDEIMTTSPSLELNDSESLAALGASLHSIQLGRRPDLTRRLGAGIAMISRATRNSELEW